MKSLCLMNIKTGSIRAVVRLDCGQNKQRNKQGSQEKRQKGNELNRIA